MSIDASTYAPPPSCENPVSGPQAPQIRVRERVRVSRLSVEEALW